MINGTGNTLDNTIIGNDAANFCAGANLAGRDRSKDSGAASALYQQGIRLYGTAKPIVAALQGSTVGGGLGIALAADFRVMADDAKPLFTRAPATGKHVAVVGAGPAGLAAAHDLALLGFRPVVFETEPVPAGMLALGVPAYRLPREVIAREVAVIEALGMHRPVVAGQSWGGNVVVELAASRPDVLCGAVAVDGGFIHDFGCAQKVCALIGEAKGARGQNRATDPIEGGSPRVTRHRIDPVDRV